MASTWYFHLLRFIGIGRVSEVYCSITDVSIQSSRPNFCCALKLVFKSEKTRSAAADEG